MQRVLENLAAQKLAANPLGPKTVFNIGADAATGSGNAIASAFALSSLGMPGSGWTLGRTDCSWASEAIYGAPFWA